MPCNTSPTILRGSLIGAVAALGLAFTAPVHAQPANDHDYSNGDSSSVGDIVVTGRRHAERSTTTGAPIEEVSLSRRVYAGDLDLGSRWGMHELRVRVTSAAREACDQLDETYPVTAQDSPPCVRRAVEETMDNLPMNEAANY